MPGEKKLPEDAQRLRFIGSSLQAKYVIESNADVAAKETRALAKSHFDFGAASGNYSDAFFSRKRRGSFPGSARDAGSYRKIIAACA